MEKAKQGITVLGR